MIFYIHTDLTTYLGLEKIKKDTLSYESSSLINKISEQMLTDIKNIFGKDIMLPTYNYNFPIKKIFNVSKEKSETGIFTEYCRKKNNFYRSYMPMFSSISLNKNLVNQKIRKKMNPFDKHSDFEKLINEKGKIVNFGSSFSPTFIHFIENKFENGPTYRYKKKFKGKIITPDNSNHNVILELYVRPKDVNLNYEVQRVRKELKKEGILKSYTFEKKIKYDVTDAKNFLDYVMQKIKKNKLYFLDKKSQKLINKIIKPNEKRLFKKDFEYNVFW